MPSLTIRQASENVGGLSHTSKLNKISKQDLKSFVDTGGDLKEIKTKDGLVRVRSWGISARHCKTGGKLVQVAGSNCWNCYAMEGFYAMESSMTASDRRLDSHLEDRKVFEDSMVYLCQNSKPIQKSGQFRWFDNGDIYDFAMLETLVNIAVRVPSVTFWCPTKEYKMVQKWQRENGEFPVNFIIRPTAPMRDTRLKNDRYRNNCTVFSPLKFYKESAENTDSSIAFCQAYESANQCLDCTACYDINIKTVVYKYRDFGKD